MNNLNETYRAIMKANKLTQKDVAKMMGYAGQATVGKYLHDGVTLGNIYDLAKALGYTIVIEKKQGQGKKTERYEIER